MLLIRYQFSVILIIGFILAFLSASAYCVIKEPKDHHHRRHHRSTQQQQQRVVSRSRATTTMNQERQFGDLATNNNDDDLVDNAHNNNDNDDQNDDDDNDISNEVCVTKTISIAFCGNSMLYFNDSPRQLELLITIASQEPRINVIQDSCLRGGATLSSLYEDGNGMSNKFKTIPATFQLRDILPNLIPTGPICSNSDTKIDPEKDSVVSKIETKTKIHYDIGSHTVEQMIQSRSSWDYIIMNDYTQGPARLKSRHETQHILRTKYAPLILSNHNNNKDNTVVIVIQTPAYQKENIKDSKDLGNFIRFTNLLAEGTNAYVQTLKDTGITNVYIAPVGEAYRYIYQHNQTLWKLLYSWDHFHPSPYGTYLQICVLYCIMFQRCVPNDIGYNDQYWSYSRIMQPIDEEPLPRPSIEEANELRRVACLVTGVKNKEDDDENNNVDENDEKDQNDEDDEIDRSSG